MTLVSGTPGQGHRRTAGVLGVAWRGSGVGAAADHHGIQKARYQVVVQSGGYPGAAVAAFVYGLSMIERGRPVWLAFVVDDFELLASTAIERSAQSRFAETYRDSWSRGPALSLPTIRVIPSLPGRSVMMRCLRGGGARGSPSCSIRASFSAVGSGCCRHTSTPSGRCTRSAAPGATGKAA